jgi:hypothetical protein
MMLLPLLSLLIPVGAVGFFGWLALRYVRARERETTNRISSPPSEELARLQDAVTSLQTDIHALRERQDFMERLLERPRSSTDPT